jgi:hypothetical protein
MYSRVRNEGTKKKEQKEWGYAMLEPPCAFLPLRMLESAG